MAVVAVLSALIGATASGAHAQGNAHPAAAERFVLSGVIVFEEGTGLAWLQEPSLTGDQVVVLRPGESVGPYRLTQILEDRVELQGPAGKVLVPIYSAQGGLGRAIASVPPQAPRPTPSPPPGVAPVVTPGNPFATLAGPAPQPVRSSSRLGAEIAAGLRERVEAVRRQAQEQKAAEAQAPALENPFANNPNVIYYPIGDPRRRQGFGEIFGGR